MRSLNGGQAIWKILDLKCRTGGVSMKNSIKNLKNYFKLIVTAVTCFVMSIVSKNEDIGENMSEIKKSGKRSSIWGSLGIKLVGETPKAKMISEHIVKDMDSKKKQFGTQQDKRKNLRKNKIIDWNEPRIQNKINKTVYFNTA